MILEQIKSHLAEAAKHANAAELAKEAKAASLRVVKALVADLTDDEKKLAGKVIETYEKLRDEAASKVQDIVR